MNWRLAILDFGGDKSFVDDLNKEQGAVSSRVALLLRSAEAKPLLYRFVKLSVLACGSGQVVMKLDIALKTKKVQGRFIMDFDTFCRRLVQGRSFLWF